jgi:uncharacterized LabA/DUF88 family protein
MPPRILKDFGSIMSIDSSVAALRELSERDVDFGLRQKGVDMRIGLDIASMTLKPAAKLARREGVEFLLDPLWQQVSDDPNEHVDGVVSVFPKPSTDEQSLAAG